MCRFGQLAAPLGLALLLGGIPHDAGAASVSGRLFLGSQLLDLDEQPELGPSPGPLSDSLSAVPGPGAIGSGSASVSYHVEFGRIRESAAMEVSAPASLDPNVLIDSGATATASWTDQITFSAPGLAGTIGFFRPRMSVTGSYDGQAGGVDDDLVVSMSNSDFLVTVRSDARTSLPGSVQQRYGGCAADATVNPCQAHDDPFGPWLLEPVPFVFGESFALDVIASASAGGRSVEGGSFRASVQLGNTIEWLGIDAVTDEEGAPIAGYALSSVSGFDYVTGVVPEPGTGMLLAAGLVGFGVKGRTGRRP